MFFVVVFFTEEGDFKLKPGSTYTYDYETTTTTTVQGSSQDKTQIQLTAQADFEVLSKCDLSLRVSRNLSIFILRDSQQTGTTSIFFSFTYMYV